MTFAAYETSDFDGQPVGLYRFQWGNSAWAYNSSDREFVVDSVTFLPMPITEKPLVQGGREAEFTLNVPSNLPVVDLFRGTPPSEPVTLIVYRIHYGDIDAEPKIVWVGPVASVINDDEGSSEIVSRNRGLRRGGLRLTWSRQCPHVTFGPGCGLDKADFAVARAITAITGNVLTLDDVSPSAAYFDGGYLEWDADGLGTPNRRTIEIEVSAGQYQLFGRADGLEVGMNVTLYPGDDHSMATCIAKFDNQANNGCVDFMPGKSPFDGQALM